jgi:hypothetical protein
MSKNKFDKLVKGPPPYKQFPNSKTIQAVFSGPKRKDKKPVVCEHNRVDYKAMESLAKRSFTIIDRLSKAIIILEDRLHRYEKDKS